MNKNIKIAKELVIIAKEIINKQNNKQKIAFKTHLTNQLISKKIKDLLSLPIKDFELYIDKKDGYVKIKPYDQEINIKLQDGINMKFHTIIDKNGSEKILAKAYGKNIGIFQKLFGKIEYKNENDFLADELKTINENYLKQYKNEHKNERAYISNGKIIYENLQQYDIVLNKIKKQYNFLIDSPFGWIIFAIETLTDLKINF